MEENPASDDLQISGLVLTKEFTDDPVLPGGTVTLRFTIENQSPSDDATGITFEDLLDPFVLPGLTATGLPLTDPCGSGSMLISFSAPAVVSPPFPAILEGLRLTGGILDAGEMCTFDVTLEVPALTAEDPPMPTDGIYPNTTRDFEATIDESEVPTPFANAADDLVVDGDLLELTKEFINDPVAPGGTGTLTFTITNLDPTETASSIAFTDDLDAALLDLVATGLPIAACGGTVDSSDGGKTIELSLGSLAGGDTCMFDVSFVVPLAALDGTTAVNTTSPVTGTIGGLEVTGDPATDELQIGTLTLIKSFDGPTLPGGTPTLTFTIENLSSSESVTDLEFSDNLDDVIADLEATSFSPDPPCGSGSMIAGTSFLTFSGGNLGPLARISHSLCFSARKAGI